MTRLLITSAAAILSAAIVFGLFAFLLWSINPGDWTGDLRFYCAWFALLVACLASRAAWDLTE